MERSSFEPSTTGSGFDQSYSYFDVSTGYYLNFDSYYTFTFIQKSYDMEEDLPSRAFPRSKQTISPQIPTESNYVSKFQICDKNFNNII